MKKKLPIRILCVILALLCIYLILDFSIGISARSHAHGISGDLPKSLHMYLSRDHMIYARRFIYYKENLQYFRNSENLIYFNAISFLGDLSSMTPINTEGWNTRTLSGCKYNLIDPSGTYFNFSISTKRHIPSYANPQKIYLSEMPDQRNLKNCNPYQSGVLTVNNIEYTYKSGEITQIYLEAGERGYCLAFSEYYCTHLNGFASKLLNVNTAQYATKLIHLSVEISSVFRQTRFVRIALQGLTAVLMFVWGILQKKNVPKYCKKALQIEDEDKRSQYLRDCGKLKFLLAAVFAVMALVEYCEPVFFSAFLLLYAILLGLAWWQQRLINKEAFAEVADSSLRSE